MPKINVQSKDVIKKLDKAEFEKLVIKALQKIAIFTIFYW
jgi:hypothetical protein